jgi:ergothioneine biosynthesis protein EgtB
MVVSRSASAVPDAGYLLNDYQRVRQLSMALAAPLHPEDQVVQTMPDVSPTKWHLAHTTWFFEHFVLGALADGYEAFNPHYHHLFNSYYYTVGQMFARPERGLLSRPTVAEVHAYRDHVDIAMTDLLADRADDPEIATRVTLGLHHEQQHQELLLTDIKHVLSVNPMGPAYRTDLAQPAHHAAAPLAFQPMAGGIHEIGADGAGFAFDNETPRHQVLLRDHALGHRLVTNAEYRDFMDSGAYGDPALWLSDGWATIQQSGWNRPLYWSQDLTREFTLSGWREIDPGGPVTHVSFYEADAYARACGARLPSEAEWELAAAAAPVTGNLLESNYLHPVAAAPGQNQWFGDVWEWTASAYAPYPGFRPLDGSLGEYNGKFMCNQMVVRGGSCVTSTNHIRASYRSFFYPKDRWQFLGIRLARDI